MQLDPPLGGTADGLVESAQKIRDSGLAHVVDVNDNPRARARMSGLMASVAIQRRTGIEVVPHLTPRDATLAGLESLLLGAHAEGVRNILAVTGDAPEQGDYPGTGSVYDVDAIGLVELMTRMNHGTDFHGRAIDAPTSFFPGVAVNPTADDLELEADRFHRKVAAGARFAMTQILFDLSYLESFLGADRRLPIPLLLGVWPVRSLELAVRVHNETPGIIVPDHVQERYRSAGADARRSARTSSRQLVADARELVAGVYVVAPFRRPLGVLDLLASHLAAGGPGRDRLLCARQIGFHGRERHAVAGVRADARSEDRRDDSPVRVDGRAAGVAVPDQAADRGHFSQRAAVEDIGGRADTAGARVERPVFRVAEDATESPECASAAGSTGARRPGTRSTAMSSLRSTTSACAAVALGADAVRARDDVRGSDHDVRRGNPARALDAETTGGGRDPDHARPRIANRCRRQRPRVGRCRRRRGTGDRRQRIDAGEGAEDRAAAARSG